MTITLFNSEIVPQKNMLVDDLENYLEALPEFKKYHVANDVEYFPLQDEYVLNVNLNQSALFIEAFNYLQVIPQPNIHYYYFVLKYEWSGEEVVKLHLKLDTVNTFLRNQPLKQIFTDKTTIIRQHEDRFYPSTSDFYIRNVDKVDEGIHPIKYVSKREKIEDEKLSVRGVTDWYLIYKNNANITPENQSQPVQCFCVANKPLKLAKGGGSGEDITVDLTQFPSSQYLYFDSITNPQGEVTLENGNTIKLQGDVCLVFQGLRLIATLRYNNNNGIYALSIENKDTILTNKLIFKNTKAIKVSNDYANALNDILSFSSYVIDAGTYKATEIISIDEVDRNDPFLIKIIKLPYAPDRFFFSGDIISYYPDRWEIKNGMFKLKKLSFEFSNNIDPLYIEDMKLLPPTITGLEAKDEIYESKLFNSNFYSLRLVYDQFNYEIPLELFDKEATAIIQDFEFPITFKPTNTINSNLLFKFDLDNFLLTSFDFPNILMSNRNNEITIYNSEYIRYINYGYNRDKERLGRQNAMNWVNTSLSLGSSILGMGVGINSGKIAGGMIATSGFTGVQSAIGSIGSNIVSLIDNEASLAQKLDNAKLAGTTISGNNDNDLMSYYTGGNKLWKITAKCSEEMTKAVYNLFYYCGYARGYQGVPSFDSRIYFNYVQCSPVFNTKFSNQIKSEYLDDISARFENGVTIYHKYNNNYDFEQSKENWEVSLL